MNGVNADVDNIDVNSFEMNVHPFDHILFRCKNDAFQEQWMEHILWMWGAKEFRNVYKTRTPFRILIVLKKKLEYDIVQRVVERHNINFKYYSDYQLGTRETIIVAPDELIECTDEFRAKRETLKDQRIRRNQVKATKKYRMKMKEKKLSGDQPGLKENGITQRIDDEQTQMEQFRSRLEHNLDQLKIVLDTCEIHKDVLAGTLV